MTDPRLSLARGWVRAAAWPAWRSFRTALRDPEGAQEAVLRRVVSGMARSAYGRRHGLVAGDGYAAFRDKLPVVDYDALAPWIERQRATEERVLCPEPVRFYEKTTGSSGPEKWIPYTRSLHRSFGRLFQLWLRDLLVHGPRLETGRTWLSVSPFGLSGGRTTRGVPVGLESDADYVEGWLGAALSSFWTVPPGVRRLVAAADYRDGVAAHLLAEEGLEVISLWNPSMLDAVLAHAVARRDALLAALRARRLERGGLVFPLRASSRRVAALESLLRRSDAELVDWTAVWPRLKLLSCWDQGHAGGAAEAARRLLPGVFFQGKGHLATEGPITLPLLEAGGHLPLLDEVFLEFEEPDGTIRRLHELEPGRDYALLLTQAGGLCRYRLGDRVLAGERWLATPRLSLLGRADAVSDLAGEKLHADFAAAALREATEPSTRFSLLAPLPGATGVPARYLLLLDRSAWSGEELSRRLEERLCESPHYRSARLMGQLAGVAVCLRKDARELVEGHLVAQGRAWGALKPAPLVTDPAAGAAIAARALHGEPVP